MIIKGKSRAAPRQLGTYLSSPGKNERIELLEVRGTVARDVPGAIAEMGALAAGTNCEKPLYHAQINPHPRFPLTHDQCFVSVDALEAELGLTGHARVVVLHEKLGRQHLHIAWTRIDIEKMSAVSDSFNYVKHERVSRDLERRFGHDRVQGAHHERDGVKRPDRTPSRSELRQEERTGIKGQAVKTEVTAAFQASDSPEAFRAALEERGYQLAKGDRRDYVIVDRAGGVHNLARRIDGMKAAELREFMAPLDPMSLPDTERAKAIVAERLLQAQEADLQRKAAKVEKDYSRGDDYVSQTTAALKDHQRRQEKLNNQGPIKVTGRPSLQRAPKPQDEKFTQAASKITDHPVDDAREVSKAAKEGVY